MTAVAASGRVRPPAPADQASAVLTQAVAVQASTIVLVAGVPLIEMPTDQSTTDASGYGPEKPAAERITGQRAAGTADDCADRTVTAAALMVIIAIMPVVGMTLIVVTRVLIALGEYRRCKNKRSGQRSKYSCAL